MPNAKDNAGLEPQRILVLGNAGSGKTTQIMTLPGKKFAYIFDPNSLQSLRGADIDYEQFTITPKELDPMLKGFNKGSKSDTVGGAKPEPIQMLRWVEHWNKAFAEKFFDPYDWLIMDSLSLFRSILMQRQKFLNGRYGDIEDLSDYRIAGNKLVEIMQTVAALPNLNIYCTGHLNEFQDEKTQRVKTQIDLPGSARRGLPLIFTNIWESRSTSESKQEYILLTKAEPRGFQEIRTTIKGLAPVENVTIADFTKPEASGIGALLTKHKVLPKTKAQLAAEKAAATSSPKEGGVASGAPTAAPSAQPQPAH